MRTKFNWFRIGPEGCHMTAATNIRVPKLFGISSIDERLLTSSVPYCMQFLEVNVLSWNLSVRDIGITEDRDVRSGRMRWNLMSSYSIQISKYLPTCACNICVST